MRYDNNTQKLFTKLTSLNVYYEIEFIIKHNYAWFGLTPKKEDLEPMQWDFSEITNTTLLEIDKVIKELQEKYSPESDLEQKLREQ